jgi:ribosomal protein S26
MRAQYVCDHCGEKIPEGEMSGLVIVVSEKIAAPVRDENSFLAMLNGMQGGMRRKQEEFQFCLSCAMALLIAFKSRKSHIKKYGKVVRQ